MKRKRNRSTASDELVPTYAARELSKGVPKHRMAEEGMAPRLAYQVIRDELKLDGRRVEQDEQQQRQAKGDERDPECDVSRVARDRRLLTPNDEDERSPDEGQEDDGRKERPAGHGATPDP